MIGVKTNVVEHPEVVAGRIERVADAVGDPSRIVAGTDCGFETVTTANLVCSDIVWKNSRRSTRERREPLDGSADPGIGSAAGTSGGRPGRRSDRIG